MAFTKEEFTEAVNRFMLEQKMLFTKHFQDMVDNDGNNIEFITFITSQNPRTYRATGWGCQHCACQVLEDYVKKIGTEHPVAAEESKEIH